MRRAALYGLAMLSLAAGTSSALDPRDPAAGMSPLTEGEMQDVNAKQGILLDIDVRNNVSATNTPIGCTVTVGTPNPCRMGLEFAARGGTWLMLKEYYGTLEINDLRMDASFLPASNTSYWNAARFQDTSGNCLMPSCNPNNDPAIKFSYPAADAQGTYNDFLSFVNIGRTWLEFDTTLAPITPGYMRDTSANSVFGVRMADSSALNASARMRFWGTGYVFGF